MVVAFLVAFYCSLVVEISDELEGLLVSDDALVGLFKLGRRHHVDVRLSALLEAGGHCHLIKKVHVVRDILEARLCAR